MSAKSDAPNSEQGGARPLGDNNPIVVAGNFVTDCCDDALMAGAASIADIDRLMDELQRARDFLQSEGERLRKMNASYANLAQTASASAKIIAESLGKWRDDQGNGSRNAMLRAHAPSLNSRPRCRRPAERSLTLLSGDLPEWHMLCLLAGQLWHQTCHAWTLPGGSSQEPSQGKGPPPQTEGWSYAVRLRTR